MSKIQTIVRVKFRENVDFPGVNDTSRSTISDIWPFRSSAGVADKFGLTFEDGWIVVRNRAHGTTMRYPATMVHSAIFEQDLQPAKGAP